MGKNEKAMCDLTLDDFQRYPIWEYIFEDDYPDETWMRPVTELPVNILNGRIVGTKVRLANGEFRWAIIEGVDLQSEILTRHVITLDIYDHSEWFSLAMHGYEYPRRGPQQLADFLGLPIESVFPIHYDLTPLVSCGECIAKGDIAKEPIERLPEDVILKMIIESER